MKSPKALTDSEIETASGGGRVLGHTPEWRDLRAGDPGKTGLSSRYIGETEKNLAATTRGAGLVTHELTHVVQKRG